MEKIEETKITYSVNCPECDKMIKGNSPETVEWNLKIHLDAKHNQSLKPKKELKGRDLLRP